MKVIQKKVHRPVLLGVVCLFAALTTRGQYNIVPLPAGVIYSKAQLWDLSITNSGTSMVEAAIQLVIKDDQTQQTILSATSGAFNLPPGAKSLQMQNLEPISYSYGPGVAIDRSSNGALPVGKYEVCYQLIVTHETPVTVAEDCEQIQIEPLSPPQLTMPENDSLVETANPSFTWVPPAPVSMFNDLNYDLIITEVYDGQSITDAIQKNLPLQQAQGLGQPFFSFPLQGPQLEKGKTYAWQVVAMNQQQYASKSEVWSFRVPDSNKVVTNSNLTYLVMGGKSTSPSLIEAGLLHVKYSSGSAFMATMVIKDEKGKVMQSTQQPVRQGDNYLDIGIGKGLLSKHNYTIYVIDGQGRLNGLTFTIK